MFDLGFGLFGRLIVYHTIHGSSGKTKKVTLQAQGPLGKHQVSNFWEELLTEYSTMTCLSCFFPVPPLPFSISQNPAKDQALAAWSPVAVLLFCFVFSIALEKLSEIFFVNVSLLD